MPFSEIVGQKRAVALIQSYLRKGTFAGSYLFHGPGGVGELKLAEATAKAIFCPELEADFCDRCRTCRRISNRTFSDVFWLEPQDLDEQNDNKKSTESRQRQEIYRIEQIRDLQKAAILYPHEAKSKVFVLNRAERMRPESANCLLKLLEEPSPFSILILITSSPHALLPTVLSRCQKVRLSPLPREAVVDRLIAGGMSEEQAARLAPLAGGKLDQTDDIISGSLTESRKDLADTFRGILRGTDYEALATASQYAAKKNRAREDSMEFLSLLATALRDALLLRYGEHSDRLGSGISEALLNKIFAAVPERGLITHFEKTVAARDRLRRNANIELVLVGLLTGLRRTQGTPHSQKT